MFIAERQGTEPIHLTTYISASLASNISNR